MIKKVIYFLVVLLTFAWLNHNYIYADAEERQNDYKELVDINIWTFNEYWYKITELFFTLKQNFEVNWSFGTKTLNDLLKLVKAWYNYLPDNLTNKKYLNDVESALQKWLKNSNELVYIDISRSLEKYLYSTDISKITWTIEANPNSWNAPLNVTLRAKITDPTWTSIPKDNYIWWIDNAWKKNIIWKWLSINYTFNNEWKFSIFLDVLSSHRNNSNYIDVLPFRSRADIDVKEKIANLNIKVNYTDLGNNEILKFSPENGSYWLIFDATSSIPTTWSKFLKTTWDFWNWIKRENEWSPKVEKVVYATKWEYNVKLTLKTNELKEIVRKFIISINNPIATIASTQEEWFIWDRFTFSAKTSISEKNATYNWEIVDIDNNKTILEKAWSLFTYEFSKKWKFNIKLKVTSPSWEIDNDNKIIYINSRAPNAEFSYSIPNPSSPNRVLFDATKSYDEDYSDDGKLEYSWEINWQKIQLENPNFNWAVWYYTFDSVWDHSVVLEVTDPDSIKSLKKDRVKISSILSVSFDADPLVAKRDSSIKFTVDSKEAKFYKWNFWDENIDTSSNNTINHLFNKSGIFNVNLEVSDDSANVNTYNKNVYVSDSEYPFALIDITYENWFNLSYDSNACDWKWAYIADRIEGVKFSWQKSINIDWTTNWLSYSWKIWQDSISSNSSVIKKIDEIWCFPVKLSVKSNKNDKIHISETYVQVKNILPTMSSLSINVVDLNSDPIIVNLKAIWDKDKDWVILSYLWYYYTEDQEPQDYRSTIKPETTFVLPKISWKYYFTVVLKDNNEEKFSSESLWTKSFIDLVWDNANTPLVDLSVNDSSVSVWDSVEFTTKIKNILWQDLTSKATYSWDFNWDWFYDKEVIWDWNITYKFENSWTYHVKVKAKYKWISNVKTITIDVANNLIPDFDYISILNKTIFLNKSLWEYDDITWDLWDGNIKDSKESFIYTYYDGKSVHQVNLKISEWDKFKEVKKNVVKNTKNYITANKKWLNIFSKPELNSSGGIILENKNDKVFLYLWESKLDTYKYIVDYDINYDSDLNWWKDDDEDNKDTPSYKNWYPLEIKLNDYKTQIIWITLKDSSDKILIKQNITISKKYITEEKKEDIIFTWVSKSDEEKIASLKNYISKLPESYKATWTKYIERLQSEWFDETEKTKVILEFEGFIDNPNIPNSTEIINLLESILISWEEDKSQKNIAFTALKNLITTSISCDFDNKVYKTCKDYLVSVLEEIKNSSNIDKNTELWKTILTSIASDSSMTTKEKEDFKEILRILINWEIPTSAEEIKVVSGEKWFFSAILWFLKWLALVIMYIILFIGVIVLWFWLYYKFMSKDITKSFEEFILEKTKFKKTDSEWLTWLDDTKNTKIENNIKEEPIKDPFAFDSIDENNNISTDVKEEQIPDWLKASFEPTWTKENNITKVENNTNSEVVNNVPPDYTENVISQNIEVPTTKNEVLEESKNIDESISKDISVKNDIIKNEENDITTIDEPAIPDWLKSSLQTEKSQDNLSDDSTKVTIIDDNKEEINEDTKEIVEIPIEENSQIDDDKEEIWEIAKIESSTNNDLQINEDITTIDEPVIPDWLKSSIQTESTEEKIKKEESIEKKKPKNKQIKQKTITPSEEEDKWNKTTQAWDELWHDDMSVPNWLKDDNK